MAEARAVLRFVRVAPRKARPVVDMIRGQQVPLALAMLKHLPRHAARVIEKVLRSAVGRRWPTPSRRSWGTASRCGSQRRS
jgi:large subunit ribosomal protein L22